MFLRRLRNRGVAMICYAVLLAFITGIGGLFMSDKSLSGAIDNVVNSAVSIIGLDSASSAPSISANLNFDTKTRAYEAAVKAAVDKLYSKFNKEDKPLACIAWDKDGNIRKYGYFDPSASNGVRLYSDNNAKTNSGVENINALFGSSVDDPKFSGYIAFDKDAQVIKNLNSYNISSPHMDYTHFDFKSKDVPCKYIQIECKNNNKPNFFSFCPSTDININSNFDGDKSLYE